ncbi:MAG: ATP-binding protein [Planctomycetota bacterium]
MAAQRLRLPLPRRLGFRMGLVLFAGLFLVDLVMIPFWNWLWLALSPEWFEPDYLRAYAAHLETLTPDELEAARWDMGSYSLLDNAALLGAMALYAALFSLVLGSFVSFLATRRISELTRTASTPGTDGQEVPGPFRVAGRDEIAQLGTAMDGMRSEILALLERIEERDRSRRRWVAEVSHDLRTPLAALAVSLDQALPLARGIPEPEQREALEGTLAAAGLDVRRVQDLAEDLLEIARLDAGDALQLEPVPVGELARDAARALSPLADGSAVRLRVELPPGLPELRADGRRLMRALENLLLNSIQHARSEVTLRARHVDDAVHLVVEDDGEGLPDSGKGAHEDLQRPRSRPDSAGIGLEVADKVVRAHGGALRARNRPEGGARVEMHVPLAPARDS